VSALAAALGFSPQDRVLIVHQDDVGMCHGANRAFLELSRDGFVTCGSVMAPCPWFREIAEAAAADARLDLGVHLTLTSEWQHYRWGPISTASSTSGLIDADGYLWRNCLLLREHLVVEAVEVELRAQIDRALAAGIDVTHLDTHMGAALVPELAGLYLRLGREYRLPVLLPRAMPDYLGVLRMGEADPEFYRALIAQENAAGRPGVDHFRMTPGVESHEAEATYRAMIAGIPAGVTFLALHCNAPGDIETIVPPRAHWRTDEYRMLAGRAFGDWAAAQGITTIGYRRIRELVRGS
jgi:hypothetical protein